MTEKTKKDKKTKNLKFAKIFAGTCFLIFAFIITIGIVSGKKTNTQAISSEVQKVMSKKDSDINKLLTTNNVKKAYIISSKDISHATRTRYDSYIFSNDVTTNDELLATAASAAMQIQKEKRVQYSSVVMFDSQERKTTYLVVDFAPDRKGIMGEKDSGSQFKVTWYNKLPQ